MDDSHCPLTQALAALDEIAPGAPVLALGQTVFWDEPMKAGVALGMARHAVPRRFVAGVHDTDYFAKLPTGRRQRGKFRALPHNDVSTKGLWSAAAEFSTLFGSETVPSKERLVQAGLRIPLLEGQKPGFLEEATEAWGWRGVVSLDEHAPITKDVRLAQVFEALHQTLDWAVDTTLEGLSDASRKAAEPAAHALMELVCEHVDDPRLTLADLYEGILPKAFELVAGRPVELETTRTTRLLRFNRETASLPRFRLAAYFVESATRDTACKAYDQAIREGKGFYELARFGTGAIPFDLVIPGIGRGTVRLGNRGAVIMTPTPQFLSFSKPIQSLQEFAERVEAKFGPDCVLIGKAVTLIGMLGREFVFAFHEGASSYVRHSRTLHRLLQEAGMDVACHPILRISYRTWDALSVACTWMRLPELLRRPFGTEELCAPSFARRWREVGAEQEALLQELAGARRSPELLSVLERRLGGSWRKVAEEYAELQSSLAAFRERIATVRSERLALYADLRARKGAVREAEERSGAHFRAQVFERSPSPEDHAERARLQSEVANAHAELAACRERLADAMRRQHHVSREPELAELVRRKRSLETEAELMRLKLVREAVLASQGLAAANRRPSAWWFPLLSPDGLWFRETVQTASYCLEPLL